MLFFRGVRGVIILKNRIEDRAVYFSITVCWKLSSPGCAGDEFTGTAALHTCTGAQYTTRNPNWIAKYWFEGLNGKMYLKLAIWVNIWFFGAKGSWTRRHLEGSHPQKPLEGIQSECDYEDVWSNTPTTSTMKTGSHMKSPTPQGTQNHRLRPLKWVVLRNTLSHGVLRIKMRQKKTVEIVSHYFENWR